MREAILPLSQYVLVVWCLVKHGDNFTFTFCLLSGGMRVKSAVSKVGFGWTSSCGKFGCARTVYVALW